MDPTLTTTSNQLSPKELIPTLEETVYVNQVQSLTLAEQLFIVVLIVGLAVIINFIFTRWLTKIAKKSATPYDDILVKNITSPLYWTFILFGASFALIALGLSESLISFVNRVLFSLLAVIWLRAIDFAGQAIITQVITKNNQDKGMVDLDIIPFINGFWRLSIYIIILLMILSIWGVNIGPLLASAGIIGAAVAFGAKDTIANFFGGLSIFFDKPFKVGDLIEIDQNSQGRVIEIGIRSTRIRSGDNVYAIVPNSLLASNVVINQSGGDPRIRIKIPVGVAYDSDLDKVEKVLLDIVNNHPKVVKKPPTFVRFKAFGESSIEVTVFATVEKIAIRGRVRHELIKSIKLRFEKEKISIPFPQRDINLKK